MAQQPVTGYAGKILRVDLRTETITEETPDEATLRRWVGGVGLGAKYLYEEVPPGVNWDDAENRLIVSSGPFGGTKLGGTGTISISTKGCLTGGATSTQANGFMGAYMKFAGYDTIILQGRAQRWLYLYLHDGTAELRDARHLLGKNTWETEDAIKAELGFGEREMSVFCIGPAGENLVKFAGIFGDKDHCAGHNGVGAVMGAKKLKAFCAKRGNGSVAVKEPERVSQIAKSIWETMNSGGSIAPRLFAWGTGGAYEEGDGRVKRGTLPVRNYTTTLYPETRLMTSQYAREHWKARNNPCWACRAHHCHMITITDGPYQGLTVEEPEYELYAACGPLIGNTDPAETLVLANLLTLLGLEGNEAGFLVSMTIELYEKGVLTREKTDGLELTWGGTKAVRTLFERIAARQGGFASLLAEGTKAAAGKLGPEAVACGVYTLKGHSPRGHDHRAMWREMFDTATSDIGTYASGNIGGDPEVHSLTKPFSPEDVSSNVALAKGRRQFADTIGACIFTTMVPAKMLAEALNAVTGWDFTAREAQDVGFRATNVMRAFNLRHGVGVENERPSARWSEAPVDGPAKGISIDEHWDGMLENYYKLMGWDRKTGRPLPETLKSLGLEKITADLWGKAWRG